MSETATRADVVLAYQLILGREPESEQAIADWLAAALSRDGLIEWFFHSEEFKKTAWLKAMAAAREAFASSPHPAAPPGRFSRPQG